jgi:hypothetical protein
LQPKEEKKKKEPYRPPPPPAKVKTVEKEELVIPEHMREAMLRNEVESQNELENELMRSEYSGKRLIVIHLFRNFHFC